LPHCITQITPPPAAAQVFIFIRLGEQVRHASENKKPARRAGALLPDED
jgi:hypothetical protein